MRGLALDALVDLISEIKQARAAGVAEDRTTSALECQRKAQFLEDFIEAENSMGFHAPQEGARLLARSLDYSRRGVQALLQGALPPVNEPQDVHSIGQGLTSTGLLISTNNRKWAMTSH